jgi:aryl-alcohol dehydrogenase-like predicted oxidoreductase
VLGELGIGLVAWSPLGAGFFAGSPIASARRRGLQDQPPALQRENLAANRDRYAPLRGLASELGVTPAQLALAWLLHQGEDVIPIPSTRTRTTSTRTSPPPRRARRGDARADRRDRARRAAAGSPLL